MRDQISAKAIEAYKAAHPSKPHEQWDERGCVNLAIAIIKEAQRAYVCAWVALKQYDADALKHPACVHEKERAELARNLKMARDFFESSYFDTLSLNQTDAVDVLRYLGRVAERRFRKCQRNIAR